MGLDAVVYRNKRNLRLEPDDEAAARLVPETGEVYFENDEISTKYLERRHAAEHRLGNISAIAELCDEVMRLIEPESFVGRKIVYSGTYSGDTIPLESLPSLSVELNLINNASQPSPELHHLVRSLEELIRAAKEEGNPIVFV
jgi:hypothetical protein